MTNPSMVWHFRGFVSLSQQLRTCALGRSSHCRSISAGQHSWSALWNCTKGFKGGVPGQIRSPVPTEFQIPQTPNSTVKTPAVNQSGGARLLGHAGPPMCHPRGLGRPRPTVWGKSHQHQDLFDPRKLYRKKIAEQRRMLAMLRLAVPPHMITSGAQNDIRFSQGI